MYKAGVALKRKIAFPRFNTMKVWKGNRERKERWIKICIMSQQCRSCIWSGFVNEAGQAESTSGSTCLAPQLDWNSSSYLHLAPLLAWAASAVRFNISPAGSAQLTVTQICKIHTTKPLMTQLCYIPKCASFTFICKWLIIFKNNQNQCNLKERSLHSAGLQSCAGSKKGKNAKRFYTIHTFCS